MPWHIAKSDRCSPSKPFAVIKDDDDTISGCHPTEASARRQLAALYAQESLNKAGHMEHLTLKATTTVQADEGSFTAVISTIAVDRHKDIVDPDGLVRALHKWVDVGKLIPLAWHHSTRPEDIIGHIDPVTARNNNGVVVDGWIDQDVDPAGKHAWRLVKAGTLGFSYGYIPLEQEPRKGGGFHIKEADVFEITATPVPANHETRVMGWKSAKAQTAELRAALDESLLPEVPPAPDPEPDPEPVPEPEPVPPPSEQEVRKQADVVVREQARAAKRDVPPPPPDPMEVAFKDFNPAGKTPKQIAEALDDLKLGDMTLRVRVLTNNEKTLEQERMIKQAEADKEPKVRSVDPLVREAQAISLEFASKGAPPSQVKAPLAPDPGPSLDELRREWAEMVQVHMRGTHEN